MSFVASSLRSAAAAALLVAASAGLASAQNATPATAKHPVVCAKGVRIYTERTQVPTPFDTLTIPAPDGPIRVSSPEEAEAAELALRARAGSVGATAVLITEEVTDEGGGNQQVRRRATGIYVPADSARAQQACK